MAKFTLRERQGTGVDVPAPNPPPPNNVGDQLLIIDRELEDEHGNLVGSFVFRATIVKRFAQDDIAVTFQATNTLNEGVINTQGVVRFNDFTSPNGVTFAIVGGTRKYKKAHGTVTGKVVASNPPFTQFTFRVL
jgi:Allene oxide cyclase barrel like domain